MEQRRKDEQALKFWSGAFRHHEGSTIAQREKNQQSHKGQRDEQAFKVSYACIMEADVCGITTK